jgi:pseudoazurin
MSKDTEMTRAGVAASMMLALLAAPPAAAEEHMVRMLTHGPDHMMQFDPELVKAAPGDTVHFVATEKGHSVRSIDGMIPDGAESFSGDLSQDLTITLKTEGVYGYACLPHGGLGMVGLIVVGHPTNEGAAKNADVPGLARREFTKLFQQLDSKLAAGE